MNTKKLHFKKVLILMLLAIGGLGSTSCTKQSGCEFVEGDTYTGRFQYYREALTKIGNNVHAELEFDYNEGVLGVVYFDGFIPKEFRTDQALQVTLVGEPIGNFQYYPIYHRIRCIEKID